MLTGFLKFFLAVWIIDLVGGTFGNTIGIVTLLLFLGLWLNSVYKKRTLNNINKEEKYIEVVSTPKKEAKPKELFKNKKRNGYYTLWECEDVIINFKEDEDEPSRDYKFHRWALDRNKGDDWIFVTDITDEEYIIDPYFGIEGNITWNGQEFDLWDYFFSAAFGDEAMDKVDDKKDKFLDKLYPDDEKSK